MTNTLIRSGLLLALIACLTACQLSFQGSQPAEEVIVTQPTLQVAPPTVTTAPVTAAKTATPQPTSTTAPTSNPVVLPACAPRTDWKTYVVQAGDTLSAIARRTGSTSADLTKGNCLNNPDAIAVGQSLYVPSVPLPPTATPVPTNVPAATCSGQLIASYGLRSGPAETYASVTQLAGGDTLQIAERSGTGWYRVIVPGLNQPAWVIAALLGLNPNCNSATIPVNTAGTVGGTKTMNFPQANMTFDYPAAWYTEFNGDGLPGGYVATFPLNMMPPAAMGWSVEMTFISFVMFPDGLTMGDITAQAKADTDNIRQMNGRISVVKDPAPYTTTSGLNGVMYETAGPGGGRVYYFNLNGKFVQMMIEGNYSVGEPVINSLRISS